ncbi:MAG: hypothetical protein HRU34_00325 [Richelia sp.]|nr:hypothetical protein [Richelia sp.]
MKSTLKYSARSILAMQLVTGLLSGVAGFTSINSASAQRVIVNRAIAPEYVYSAILPRRIARRVMRHTSGKLGVPRRYLIYKATPKTFSNPCVFYFGEICTREYRPISGWKVKVKGKGESITYHVANNGMYIADLNAD